MEFILLKAFSQNIFGGMLPDSLAMFACCGFMALIHQTLDQRQVHHPYEIFATQRLIRLD